MLNKEAGDALDNLKRIHEREQDTTREKSNVDSNISRTFLYFISMNTNSCLSIFLMINALISREFSRDCGDSPATSASYLACETKEATSRCKGNFNPIVTSDNWQDTIAITQRQLHVFPEIETCGFICIPH